MPLCWQVSLWKPELWSGAMPKAQTIRQRFTMLSYGYASINGSGTFRGDPHVWNGHFRKTSVPHVWNGVNWIMIISVHATSKASNDFALATKLFLHQVRFHGTVWKRSGTVWNRSGTVWNEVWNGIGRFAPNLGNGTGSKMFQLSCC